MVGEQAVKEAIIDKTNKVSYASLPRNMSDDATTFKTDTESPVSR